MASGLAHSLLAPARRGRCRPGQRAAAPTGRISTACGRSRSGSSCSPTHSAWVNDGGTSGVTAFFVLSGYVITIAPARNQASGRSRRGLVAFYRRRFVRLGPALLGMLAFVIVVGVAAGWPTEWRLGILACLAYVSNWVQVAGINIDPLGHTWSLAIEEQFYLLWPALHPRGVPRSGWAG